MMNAVERIISITKNIGIIGFFVDAKDESAKIFYQNYGFIALETNPLCLFLPIQTLMAITENKIALEPA